MKLTLNGITIDVISEADIAYYLRCGYKKVNNVPVKPKEQKETQPDSKTSTSVGTEKADEA